MTERTDKAITLALITLAKAFETAASSLRTISERELPETPPAKPCVAPQFVPEPLIEVPPGIVSSSFNPAEVLMAAQPTTDQPSAAPSEDVSVTEFQDLVGNQLWLIDEVGNVTVNGILRYVAPIDDAAKSFTIIGPALWFRTALGRWFKVGAKGTPEQQSTNPETPS